MPREMNVRVGLQIQSCKVTSRRQSTFSLQWFGKSEKMLDEHLIRESREFSAALGDGRIYILPL